MVIQLELEFDGRLRQDILERACDLVLDVEPVLGCRLDIEQPTPHWRRLPFAASRAHRRRDAAEYEAARTAGLDPTRGHRSRSACGREPPATGYS